MGDSSRPISRLLVAAVLAEVLLALANPTFAEQAPSYTDVFKYNWKAPEGKTYTCPTGWKARGVTCYKVYSELMSWKDALSVCTNSGGQLAKVEELNTNVFIGEQVISAGAGIKEYWIGFMRKDTAGYVGYWSDETVSDTVVGNWMADQPDDKSGLCVKVNNDTSKLYQWTMHWCGAKLPFVCQLHACLEGEFQCNNGKCINNALRRDGEDDCGDKSDEVGLTGLCLYHKQESSGVIKSSNYPSNYDNSADCLWILEGPVGTKLQLKVTAFDTEENIDIVDIYVGSNTIEASNYVASLSGHIDSAKLPTYVSTNNFLIVKFTSDKAVAKTGFSATFTAEKQQTPGMDDALQAGKNPSFVTSPRYPVKYFSNSKFSWIVTAPKYSIITIEHIDVDLGTGDSVTIRDGDKPTDVVLAHFTGDGSTGPRFVMTTGAAAYIYMDTISFEAGRGFKFSYKMGCDVTLSKDSGVIVSPGYNKQNYPNMVTCTWTIASKAAVLLVFDDTFTLGSGDKLKIYEGADKLTSPVHDALTKPSDTRALGGKLVVEFTTDAAGSAAGFSAQFSVDCDALPYNTSLTPIKISDASGTAVTGSPNTQFESSYFLECNTGYYFSQEEFGKCEASSSYVMQVACGLGGKWNITRFPQCQPVYCGAVPGVENGFVANTTSVLYEGVVQYKCFEGFTLEGSAEITCLANGSWTQEPSCKAGTCPDLGVLENGNVNATNVNQYGSVVRFDCDDGYQVDAGVPFTYCKGNQTWKDSDLKTNCSGKPCFLVPDSYEHANVSQSGVVLYGPDKVTVTCHTGYGINGSSTDNTQDITCRANQTFEDVNPCIDVDECQDKSKCSQGCTNTGGSYYCTCNDGYTLNADKKTCDDIDECDKGISGCSKFCTNFEGGYNCSCEAGYTLYLYDKFNGFDRTVSAEDGIKPGDVYRVNHTCVPVTCDAPPNRVTNGDILFHADKTFFYYQDVVEVLCDIGHVIDNGTHNVTSQMFTCNENGTWDSVFPNCTVAVCERLPETLLATLDNRPTFDYPPQPIMYGMDVAMNCSVAGGKTTQRKRTCLYDVSTHSYQLIGDSLECGLIHCEPIGEVAGLKSGILESLTNATYNANFTFECGDNFTLAGNNSDLNNIVTCMKDGKWNLGGLRCNGPVCLDPGRPADGKQSALSYEMGSIVTFTCDHTGFQPVPATIKCVAGTDGSLEWDNSDAPRCIDKAAPEFVGCPSKAVSVLLYETVNTLTPPTVTDNSGAVATFNNSYNLNSPITDATNITWSATDHAGNTAMPCQVEVRLKDETPPTIEMCPTSGIMKVDTEDMNVEKEVVASVNVTAADGKTITTNAVTPRKYTLSKATLNDAITLKQEVIDDQGFKAECTFQYVIKPKACRDWALREPANGKKTCTPQSSSGFRCELTCDTGYTFYNHSQPLVYTCTEGNEFSNNILKTFVPDCIQHSEAKYRQVFVLKYTGTVVTTSTREKYVTEIENQLTAVEDALQSQCDASMNGPPKVQLSKTINFDVIGDTAYVTYSLNYSKNADTVDVKSCASLVTDRFVGISGSLLGLEKLKEIEPAGETKITAAYESTVSDGFSCLDGKLLQDGTCVPCPAGYYKNDSDSCELCPVGTYSDQSSQEKCQPCPPGTYTYSVGARSHEQCYSECPAGLMSDNRLPPCSACPPYTYSENATSCVDCPVDRNFTRGPQGGANITECKAMCAEGTFSYDGREPCRLCPKGFYQDAKGNQSCKACSGNSTLQKGSTSSDNCTAQVCDGSNVCQNEGVCAEEGGLATCSCVAGYTGALCETNINECASAPCYYGGICTDLVNGYSCACLNRTRTVLKEDAGKSVTGTPDKSMVTTEKEICQDFCANYTLCVMAMHDGTTCYTYNSEAGKTVTDVTGSTVYRKVQETSTAYNGSRCERDENDCAEDPCLHDGMCKDLHLDFECLCRTTDVYTGRRCNDRKKLCGNNDCQHGAECVEISDIRYVCNCLPGYTGKKCETNIDDCQDKPCMYGGKCTDAVAGYSCKCAEGFTGSRCETRPLPGSLCNPGPCDPHGKCVQDYTSSTVRCVCEPGFTSGHYVTLWLDASDPDDTGDDETLTKHNKVCGGATPVKARCRVKGSTETFDSTDAASQTLQVACTTDGLLCLNSNQTDNSTCHDYQIQFTCDAGGSKCMDEDMCAEERCENGATCEDLEGDGAYKCTCDPGYKGYNCQHNIDECAGNPCKNGAMCNDMVNGYNCTCLSGYTGVLCETNIDDCGMCDAAGTLKRNDQVNDCDCDCKPGKAGKNCSADYDECVSQPCYHRGVCVNGDNQYSCTCPVGWTGTQCETIITYCQPDPCKNGATCYDIFNDYFCQCKTGYDGRNCEDGPGPCSVANPCQNGGSCYVEGGEAKCKCTAHFVGAGCECAKDYCSETGGVCQHGGTCSITDIGGFSCQCPTGFEGEKCETNTDDCKGRSCGAGNCIDGVAKSFCQCPIGKIGSACTKDTDRDLDMEFTGKGSADSLYPFSLNTSSSTLGVWMQYATSNDKGTFLTINQVQSQTVDTVTKPLMVLSETGVKITVDGGSELSLAYPDGTDIKNGHWHYVAVTLALDKATLHLDGITAPQKNYIPVQPPVYAMMRAGGSDFHGKLSLLQFWNEVRDVTKEITPILNAKTGAVNSSTYTQDLVADWSWGSLQPGPGVLRLSPSQRGREVCAAGKQFNADDDTCVTRTKDKLPPSPSCPETDFGVVTSKRLLEVKFNAPTFTGHDAIAQNHQPDDVFQTGVTPVVYSASDKAGNRAQCDFNVFLRMGQCDKPEAPFDGDIKCEDVADLFSKRCNVTCTGSKKFLRPVPKFYSCGPIGVWNTESPMLKFKFPPCGDSGDVKKRLQFGWDFDLSAEFTPDNANAMKTRIKAKFETWSSEVANVGVKKSFCKNADCSDLAIDVSDYKKNFRLKFDIDAVPAIIGYNLKVVEAVTQEVLITHKFDLAPGMPGAENIDLRTFWIEEQVSCAVGFEAVGENCVKCTAGTVYNDTTKTCDDCDIGSYRTDIDATCQECGTGKTTEMTGSTSSNQCIDLCAAGYFYHNSSTGCEPCGFGYYQPDTGRTYCLPCSIGKTTRTANATSQAQCFDDCKDGTELRSNGSCVACKVGTYRKQGVEAVCQICPDTRTTPSTGAVSSTDCTLVKCVPGKYRLGSKPGTCESCPIGTFRTEEMDNCTSCGDPDNWRTDGMDKTSRADCKFYCPAGAYIVRDAQNVSRCEGCLKHTYKEATDYYADSCKACPPNKPRTMIVNATSINDCRLGNCTAGEIVNPADYTECIKCDYDTYQPEVEPGNFTRCLPCGTNSKDLHLGTKQNGTASKSDCLSFCGIGQQMKTDGMCEACPQGSYKDNKDMASRFQPCVACPANRITDTVGAVSSANCTRGNCSAGYMTDKENCIPCANGTYQPLKWQDTCVKCPTESTTSTTASTSKDDCNVYPNRTRYGFVVTLAMNWRIEYKAKGSASFKRLENRLLKSIEALFNTKLSSIFRGNLKILTLTQGSVVVLIDGLFDKTASDAEVKRRLDETLTKVIVTGTIPVPEGEDFEALPTVAKALPQVAKIPDGTGCPDGQRLSDQGSCEACPVGMYQPNDVANFCYDCSINTTTVSTGSKGNKDDVCITWCATEIAYCMNGASCQYDSYSHKPICTCTDMFEGTRCDVRIDAYSKSQLSLILGLSIGFFALFLIIMFIVASFGYRRRMREQKQKLRNHREVASPPSMTPALPMPAAYSGYSQTPRTFTGTSAPWNQPGQFMFFNDDDTNVNDRRRYPQYTPQGQYTPSTLFQR